MNNYYDPSSSFNYWPIVWVVFGLVVLVIVYLLYQKFKRDALLKRQLKLTKDWVMLKVTVPKEARADEDDQRKNFQETIQS